MQHGHARWTTSRNIQQEHAAGTNSMAAGIAAWTRSMDMLHGHIAWTCGQDMQYGHVLYRQESILAMYVFPSQKNNIV
jgi:hypothetical protein